MRTILGAGSGLGVRTRYKLKRESRSGYAAEVKNEAVEGLYTVCQHEPLLSIDTTFSFPIFHSHSYPSSPISSIAYPV